MEQAEWFRDHQCIHPILWLGKQKACLWPSQLPFYRSEVCMRHSGLGLEVDRENDLGSSDDWLRAQVGL